LDDKIQIISLKKQTQTKPKPHIIHREKPNPNTNTVAWYGLSVHKPQDECIVVINGLYKGLRERPFILS
jgi:hypothetical protein